MVNWQLREYTLHCTAILLKSQWYIGINLHFFTPFQPKGMGILGSVILPQSTRSVYPKQKWGKFKGVASSPLIGNNTLHFAENIY